MVGGVNGGRSEGWCVVLLRRWLCSAGSQNVRNEMTLKMRLRIVIVQCSAAVPEVMVILREGRVVQWRGSIGGRVEVVMWLAKQRRVDQLPDRRHFSHGGRLVLLLRVGRGGGGVRAWMQTGRVCGAVGGNVVCREDAVALRQLGAGGRIQRLE